jgi:hypothetical protein
MFPRISYVKTNGDTLNVRSEPNGSVLSTLDNGSIIETLIRPANAGGIDWIPVSNGVPVSVGGVEGWVAANFIAKATILYQAYRIIDPSVPRSNSVGTTAFKIELADKTLKFIELSAPLGIKRDELSSLSDTELVEEAINLYNRFWDRFKDNPNP